MLFFCIKPRRPIKKLLTKSCLTLGDPYTVACQAPLSWNSPGKSTGVGCQFLPQGIFLTQGSNPGVLHCRQILHLLSHQGSLAIIIGIGWNTSKAHRRGILTSLSQIGLSFRLWLSENRWHSTELKPMILLILDNFGLQKHKCFIV